MREFVLGQSYFTYGTSLTKLKLHQLTEQKSTFSPLAPATTPVVLEANPPYSLEYHALSATQTILDANLKNAQDHWGFFNGKNNQTLAPSVFLQSLGSPFLLAGANRDPKLPAAQSFTLSRLSYPTGGFTDFQYELNEVVDDRLPYPESDTPAVPTISNANHQPVYFRIDSYKNPGEGIFARINLTTPPCGSDPPQTCQKALSEGCACGTPPLITGCQTIRIQKCASNPNLDSIPRNPVLPPLNPNFCTQWVDYAVYTGYYANFSCHIHLEDGLYRLVADTPPQGNFTASLSYFPKDASSAPNKKAGGLRVRRIASYTSPSDPNPLVKEYTYVDGEGVSTGKLSNLPIYTYQQRVSQQTGDFSWQETTYQVSSSFSRATLGTTSGSYVGYGRVTELHGVGGSNGKIEYFYTSLDSIPDQNNNAFPFGPSTSQDYKRGLLKKKITYSRDGPIFRKVDILENTYVFTPIVPIPGRVRGLQVGFKIVGPIGRAYTAEDFLFATYDEISDWFYLGRSVHRVYGSATPDSVETAHDYIYGTSHLQLTKDTWTASNGKQFISEFRYPLDYTTSSGPIAAMKGARNWQNAVIEKLEKRKEGADERLLRATRFNYLQNNDYLHLGAVEMTELATPSTELVNLDYKEQLQLGYDEVGNNISQKSVASPEKVILWAYNGTLPVAEIQNATIAEVENALGAQGYTLAQLRALTDNVTMRVQLNQLRTTLTNARITSYTYTTKSSVETITDPNAKTQYYAYDAFNRLQYLRDESANGAIRASYCYNYAGQMIDCETIAPTGIVQPPPLFLLADSVAATVLQVYPDTLFMGASTASDTVWVIVQGDSLTQDWTVTIPDSVNWLSVSPMQGRNDTTAVTVQVTAASGPFSRSATFTIRSAELDTTVKVTVIQSGICLPPTIAGDSVRALCAGSSVFLLASGCPGGTIRWSTSQTGVGITVTAPGSYSAVCESADCQSAASRIILVQAVTSEAPTVVASVDTVCAGQTVQLTASGCAGAVAWNSTVTGLLSGNTYASQITVKPSQNVTFTARCLNLDCLSGASAPVAVIVKPSPDFTLATDGKALCADDTLQLSVSTTQTGLTANWQGPGGWTASGLSVKRLNAAAGVNGYYRVSVSNGICQRQDSVLVATSLIDSLAGPVISTSTIRFLEADSSYVLDLESTPADAELTYQWYRNGRLVPYAQSASWKDSLALNSPRNVVASYQVKISKAGCTARISEIFYLYKTTDSSALVLTNAVRRIEMEPGSPATIKGFDCQGTELWRDSFGEGRVSLTAMPSERQTYEINGADCAVRSDTVWLNTATLCAPNSMLYTFTERATGDVGYFNPADSLYYWKAVKEIAYNGQVDADGNCLTEERIEGYDELYSAKFFVNWLGPDGSNLRPNWYAALRIATYQVVQPWFPYLMEVSWEAIYNQPNASYRDVHPDSLSYFNVDLSRPYYLDLYKATPLNASDALKCTEVSLSATSVFDEGSVLIENSTAGSFTGGIPFKIDSILATGKEFLIVREKECATCSPVVSVDMPTSRLNHCPNSPGLITLNVNGAIPNEAGLFGPFELYRIEASGNSTLVNGALYYNPNEGWNPSNFTPNPSAGTTYTFRLKGNNWYCISTPYSTFTITANNCN